MNNTISGLARSTDPDTSHDAQRSLDLQWDDQHEEALKVYRQHGPLTDIQAANEMCKLLTFSSNMETNRRLIRTIREEHGRLVPSIGTDGEQIKSTNPSGRQALCWEPGNGSPKETVKTERYVVSDWFYCVDSKRLCRSDICKNSVCVLGSEVKNLYFKE
jgi:hypothetical protein